MALAKFTVLALEAKETGDCTVVVVVAWVGVVVWVLTPEAVFTMTVPFGTAAPTWTVNVRAVDAPAASPPTFQVTTPPARVPPPVADTKVVLAGTGSVITTPVSALEPLLCAWIV